MQTTVQSTHYAISGRRASEVADSVEQAVRTGALPPGQALPTVRGLAAELGISPSTVAAAYRDLRWRGLVSGSGRRGTRVRDNPPLSSHLPLSVPPGVVDLGTGGPDPTLLPALPLLIGETRQYGDQPVAPRLAAVAKRELAGDGIDATDLTVVGGALDGVERVVGAWLRPGDRVAVEDPGYTAAIDLLTALGLELVPVPLDEHGARPDELEGALRGGVSAVLLTPRAQNPTGAAWDPPRARELARVLARHPGVLVIEDDHAGPAAGAAMFSVCGGRERWATLRSVSKWLGPDLRLALLAGDESTVARVEGRQALGTGWVSWVLQHAVAELWDDPAVGRLLDRAAATYANRRRALRESLAGQGFAASGTSGLTTWLPVADEQGVVGGMLDRGWAVSAGARFRIASAPAIRVAFASLDPEQAARFAAALSACIHQRPRRSD